jgi:predicted outer membrane repeat protein
MIFALLGALIFHASPVNAQTTATVYSDVITFTGNAVANGGAIAGGATDLLADNITPTSGFAGDEVNSFTFSMSNSNSVTVPIHPNILFYDANGASGGPGTLIASFLFSPIDQTGGTVATYTYTTSNLFVLPTRAFRAGMYFTSSSQTLANNLGQGYFNPPTVGSSTSSFFQSTAPETVGSSPGWHDTYIFAG